MKNKEYYTTIETAKLLGVSVRTVQLWVENGSLEAWKTAGGHRRIEASSVNEYIDRHHVGGENNPSVGHTESQLEKTILIVEDNPTVAKFYQAAINSWEENISIEVKPDGFEALMEIGKSAPRLLIADIYMPGMDGLQMIRSLYRSELMRAENIIIISGLSDDGIADRGGIPSGVTFFKKPVDVQQLKQSVFEKLNIQTNN